MVFKAQLITAWLLLVLPILIVGTTKKFGIDTTLWRVILPSWFFVGVVMYLCAVWF